MKNTRILIADDDSHVCNSLSLFLEAEPGLEVVGVASSGCNAYELAMSLQPDVVLMDLSMPNGNGLQATAKIKTSSPQIKVIILTMNHGHDVVDQALIDCEADGFLIKDATAWTLRRAIEAVQQGDMFLHPRIARQVVKTLREHRILTGPH